METRDCTIITGASKGIGRAIALRMAKEGPVVLVARGTAKLREIANELWSADCLAVMVDGDVRDPETARKAVSTAKGLNWPIKNLVANAGVGKSGPLETYSLEQWSEVMDVNVTGALHFVQACLPEMLAEARGTIALMSSIVGVKGTSHDAPYVVSKHALIGLARAVAHEHGKNGISCVPICPSYVESEMTERTINGYAERHGVSYTVASRKIEGVNPQKRIIPAEEVAEAVAFVCSGKVPSLSGHPLILSGGG